jgi:REP element-mobilizing transposase RayT
MILPEIEERLYAYIVKKAGELGAYVYAINGSLDHIHLIVTVPPKLALADFVKNIKGSSSHDLNQNAGLGYEFAWQRGYGVLSLGEKQRQSAMEYVNNQKRHHQSQTTNPWLEHTSDEDESSKDLASILGNLKIQEVRGEYFAPDAFPF